MLSRKPSVVLNFPSEEGSFCWCYFKLAWFDSQPGELDPPKNLLEVLDQLLLSMSEDKQAVRHEGHLVSHDHVPIDALDVLVSVFA